METNIPQVDSENMNNDNHSDNDSDAGLIVQVHGDSYKMKLFKATTNFVIHLLLGCTVGVTLIFAFRGGLPLNAMTWHIVLSVLGYHLLMAQAILSLTPENGWSATLTLVHKRRAHWVLQILGSGMAIAGSVIKILDNNVHWTSYHGQFALVAMVFTAASLINGLTSLYAYELRRLIPPKLSKISHILFGTVAFGAASIALGYGFQKHSFKSWASPALATTVIAMTGTFTIIIIVNPFISLAYKYFYYRR